MFTSVRAKMYVSAINIQADPDRPERAVVHFNCVYSPDPDTENNKFWTATPSGSAKVAVVNPRETSYVAGKPYYLDFVPNDEGEFRVLEFKGPQSDSRGGDLGYVAVRLSSYKVIETEQNGVKHTVYPSEWAEVQMNINNPACFDFFSKDAGYDVTFSPAPTKG